MSTKILLQNFYLYNTISDNFYRIVEHDAMI